MPTDGSQKKLDRESSKRCGKYNPAKDNPDEEPIAMLLPNFKSVRERCTGARIMRGKKVVQKLHQLLRYCRNVRPTWVKFDSKDTKESEFGFEVLSTKFKKRT